MDDDERESVSSSVEGGTNPDMMQGLLLNDNFSDVDGGQMSPNVSARGSPNISGRDTPLSSHTEQQGKVWQLENVFWGVASSIARGQPHIIV